MNYLTTYTASEARNNLYDLIRAAASGLKTFEIKLRGLADSVVLINKSELESWQETLDILSSPEEIKAINAGRKSKKVYTHQQMLKKLGLND